MAGRGLPANVAIEHFNNRARHQRLRATCGPLSSIGRTLPDGQTIHRQAERLAGHPLDQDDPLVAAVRWSICEAELLQVIARARGIRRTEANPLDVFLVLTENAIRAGLASLRMTMSDSIGDEVRRG